jgi:two-component system, cell cycle response regulator
MARIGGDEFVILAANSFETSAEKLIQRLKQGLKDNHHQTKLTYTLSLSLGVAFFDPRNPCSIDTLLAQADKLMYKNKPQKG